RKCTSTDTTTRTWRRSSTITTPSITSPPGNTPTAASITRTTPTTNNITSPTTNQEPTSSYEPFLHSSVGNVKSSRFRDIELWASIGSSIVVMWLL
ncbi:22267_t:CDS:2, partial [Racocetra persica]